MRIKLERGKQKELILKAKENLSWTELSKILNISTNYLMVELKRERRLLSEEIYNKLCKLAKENYKDCIIEKLDDNWGRAKGGKISKGNTKNIAIPNRSRELAEFYGIMLGDGNLTKIKAYKLGTYQIRIVGDSRYDKDYLTYYVTQLIEKLFDIKVKLSKQKKQNAITLTSSGKKVVEFLENQGFKSGDKIKNKLNIPSWIKENEVFLKACIRGIFDTDGSVYKLPKQNVHQITLTNHNKILLKEAREALISLNIKASKISNGRKFYITKKSELRRFLKHIGFRNPRHVNKIKTWNLAL